MNEVVSKFLNFSKILQNFWIRPTLLGFLNEISSIFTRKENRNSARPLHSRDFSIFQTASLFVQSLIGQFYLGPFGIFLKNFNSKENSSKKQKSSMAEAMLEKEVNYGKFFDFNIFKKEKKSSCWKKGQWDLGTHT